MLKETNDINFEKDVIESKKSVVMYFYSDDCVQCKIMNPILKKLAMGFEKDIDIYKTNCSESKEIVKKYNIKSTPLIMFLKNGTEVCARLSGYITMSEVKNVIENILGGICKEMGHSIIKCDTLILGGGPAGLTAALYSARAKLFTVVLETNIIGGQVATTFEIANYPGSNGVITGYDLIENMKRQAESFGVQLDELKTIKEINLTGKIKKVITDDTDYYAKTIIIATGATPKRLPAKGESDFRGKGIHYCATCDAAMYPDAELLVVGGGNSAIEETLTLTKYAKHINLIHHLGEFQATQSSINTFFKMPNIDVIWNTEIVELKGDNFLNSVIIRNKKTGQEKEIPADGVFVYIGWNPNTNIFKNSVKLDDYGYILANEDMKTNIPGVFVAGDVRQKKIRQIATATGDGTIAGIMVEKYINS